jgi:site-specific DNA-methyltransferase (adenine-specific)
VHYVKIKEIEISCINEYENNPRNNEKAVEAVAESIRQFGFKVPIVVDKDFVIVAGHTRLKAANVLDMKSVPCVIADDLTEEQLKAYRLADNKTAELAEWDFEKLHEELKALNAFDMDVFGFDTLPDLMDEMNDSTEISIDDILGEEETKTKRGDIWLLGQHRLICGDCTDKAIIAQLMDGAKADLLLTDPPYNVAIENSAGLTIQNDNMSDTAFYEFLHSAFSAANSAMRDGAGFYIWHGETEGLNFRKACNAVKWNLKQCIIWVKSQITIGRQDYQWKHEPCLYGWKGGGSHYFIKNRKQATVIDEDVNLEFMTADELRKMIADIMEQSSILREDKPLKNSDHPTMKPVPLIKKQVKNSTKRGGIVLDIFGGSGTTLMACEELHRTCYMCELDERYCDVIIKRYEEMTGKKAVKLCHSGASIE